MGPGEVSLSGSGQSPRRWLYRCGFGRRKLSCLFVAINQEHLLWPTPT
jgi:hypothetical protein